MDDVGWGMDNLTLEFDTALRSSPQSTGDFFAQIGRNWKIIRTWVSWKSFYPGKVLIVSLDSLQVRCWPGTWHTLSGEHPVSDVYGHHTHGIESMSLLLLPSAACFDLRGDVFPFTLCFTSSPPASPLTRTPLASASGPPTLFLGVGVWVPEPEPEPRRDLSRDLRLAWREWVGVAWGVTSPGSPPWPHLLPRLLGVGVLFELEVTGVETVLRLEMLDCWEFRLGDRWVRVTSRPPSSACNITTNVRTTSGQSREILCYIYCSGWDVQTHFGWGIKCS